MITGVMISQNPSSLLMLTYPVPPGAFPCFGSYAAPSSLSVLKLAKSECPNPQGSY